MTSAEHTEALEISPQEVAELRNSGGDFLFIDCRTPDEREESHIEGTRLIPMQDLDLHLPDLRGNEDRLIVVHCRSGKRSRAVTAVLREHGFKKTKSMAGGIQRWFAEIERASE